MSVYCVSYDLHAPNRDYDLLYKKIKEIGSWWHHIESTWLVDTNMSAKEISTHLRPAIDSDDELLVINVGSDSAGWLDKKAWEWIRIHSQAA